jgi:hypothetical protein
MVDTRRAHRSEAPEHSASPWDGTARFYNFPCRRSNSERTGPTVIRRTTMTLSNASTREEVFFVGTGESLSTSGTLPSGRYDFQPDLALSDSTSCGSVSKPVFGDAYSSQGTASLSFSVTPGP